MAGKKWVLLLIGVVCLGVAASDMAQQTSAPAAPIALDAQTALVTTYCQGCHNDKTKSGNMTLTALDLAHPERNGVLAEKVIRKLRAGMMPPAGMKRPEAATAKAFVTTLESEMDKAAAASPNPGSRPSQRLTR